MNLSAIQYGNNSDMKRLNIRQNYPDVQAYSQNNKFPCINPSPIQGGRAEYYFKKQNNTNYHNSRGSTQYPQQQQQQLQQQQQNIQTPLFPIERQQETDLSATFTELNQENYERRKQYLEQVFESFRKHTHRMQIGNRKEPASEMKMTQNESLVSSRKKSFSHARPKTRDVSNFEDNQYVQIVNANNAMNFQINNQNQMNFQHNIQTDQPLNQSNLYDEPYSSYQNNYRTEDPLKKIDQQIKKLKPINQQYKTSNSNSNHVTPQDTARLQNNLLKDKYLQKIRQEISSANTSLNPKGRQNGVSQGENNVFLPESILNLVKKSKQQSQQNNAPTQQAFDYHY